MLNHLLNVPSTPEQWLEFSYHHRTSHDAIRAAILTKFNTNLPDYPVDPIDPGNFDQFLQFNSQLHIDMNGPTKNQGSDLQDANLNDEREKVAWIFLHYQEHFAAESALGV